jgi:hypothetical protein
VTEIKINWWACVSAAHAGHVRVLKWLVETDPHSHRPHTPWAPEHSPYVSKRMEEHTPLAAAAGGHLHVLAYVLEEYHLRDIIMMIRTLD